MMANLLADVGNVALILGLVFSIYTILAAIYGARAKRGEILASAENALFVVAGLVTLAVGVLEWALIAPELQFEYVAQHVSRDQPLFYNLSALWGGQEGSLLFWAWLLALFGVLALIQNRRQNRELIPSVMAFVALTEGFFLTLMVLLTSPFKLLDFTPAEGMGLNPLLQNPGMFFHPVTQYLGYVGFTIPFAFAIAALVTGRLNDTWIRTTRRWTLVSWLFLSLGLFFGMQWAYVELGWGGYWGWDPVENASLIPWLTGTAFLHSVMIQEKRGMLKVWNLVLVMLTFVLCILGTFITRSGVIQSVHSFGVSAMGPYFLAFMGLTVIGFLGLLLFRLDALKEENELDSVVSREASFLLNNLILVGAAFATLWGTIFPMISEVVTGKQIAVAAPFFNQVNGPIFLALMVLVGICPLIGWRRASLENLARNFLRPLVFTIVALIMLFVVGVREAYGLIAGGTAAFVLATIALEYYRGIVARMRQYAENPLAAFYNLIAHNRRRYGGYIVHAGVVLAMIGIAGSSFYQSEIQQHLAPGESVSLQRYTLKFEGLQSFPTENRQVVAANLTVLDNGARVGSLSPERDYYPASDQTTTEVAVRTTPREDLYLILAGWSDDGSATIKVLINPLVMWLWVGFAVLVGGTLIAMWPDPREVRVLAGARGKEALAGVRG